ncbi:MAG: BamA/TamA family outer membrane protein [Gemmatimonadaceae bacterium]|nr:BamA/TamA family outer membrane protein [Gemmatimonadaceae bacterium]
MGPNARRLTRRGYSRALIPFGCALLVFAFNAPARAQDLNCDRGDLEVRSLSFSGNAAFSDAELSRIIVTTASAFARRILRLPLTERRCLDRLELPKDRARLVIFYRRRGFPDAVVDTAVRSVDASGVAVTFAITEGLPTQLQSFIVKGLDSVRNRAAITRGLPVRAGGRFDRLLIEAARDTIARRLRNSGYPRAEVTNAFDIDESLRVAFDTISISTGPFTRIGKVEIEVVPFGSKKQQVPDRIVRRIVGLDPGRVYREEELLNAQRTLYRTEVYQHVSLLTDTSTSSSDSVIDIRALLAENTTRSARLGAGYGTLDCFRVTAEMSSYNFLSTARRLDLTTRVSKIGIGEPLSGLKEVCPQAKRDPFSAQLNYYLGATLRQPVFFGLRAAPTITVFSERVSEYNAYLRTTAIGGIASVELPRFPRVPVTFAYSMDLGRTEAQPALFCAVFNICDREDRRRVQQTQRLAVVSAIVSRDNSNSFVSPTRGSQWRVEARHASQYILSDTALQFNKVLAERSQYWGVSNGAVLALRVRGGAVFGQSFGSVTGFVPPQERLYAGGPTTVRGFSQNELGSAIYIARSFETIPVSSTSLMDTVFRLPDGIRDFRRAVPVGGNFLVVSNLELRLRSPFLPELLQWTLFTDAGDVWNRGRTGSFQNFSLKVTPGIQLTAFSPVGPVRLVVGYNPYDRPSGPIYFEVPGNQAVTGASPEAGSLPCVSPGNLLLVRRVGDVLVQSEGRCPATFTPRSDNGFLRRLTFGLAIGQAF